MGGDAAPPIQMFPVVAATRNTFTGTQKQALNIKIHKSIEKRIKTQRQLKEGEKGTVG